MFLLFHWMASALGILLAAYFVPGFRVDGFASALFASIVLGLVNGTVGTFLKTMTLPLGIVTFGLSFLAINALMLMLASNLVPGFSVSGFGTAFFASIVLAIFHTALGALL